MRLISYGLFVLTLMVSMAVFAGGRKDSVTVINAGYNGNNTADLLQRLNKDVLSKNPQVVVLMIGTNDMLNLRNRLSVQEYRDNYQKLITLIKKKATLFMMTIPPANADYILMRQDPKNYSAAGPLARVDSANAVIKELAAKNKCHLIDLYNILQTFGGSTTDKESLFQNEANSNVTDGVHPTANGYKVIGTAVFEALSTLVPKATSIVCFGDSITFGYKMKGQGTVNGDSYPAVLNRLFKQVDY